MTVGDLIKATTRPSRGWNRCEYRETMNEILSMVPGGATMTSIGVVQIVRRKNTSNGTNNILATLVCL